MMDTQDEPVEHGHDDAGRAEKLAGLLEQMREDASQYHVDNVAEALRQRLVDAGIQVSAEEFEDLLSEIS